jgi:hypothetical protein
MAASVPAKVGDVLSPHPLDKIVKAARMLMPTMEENDALSAGAKCGPHTMEESQAIPGFE